MSDFFVMLVLKTVICKSKLLDFQYFASLELEHNESDSRLYGQTLNNIINHKLCKFIKILKIIFYFIKI